MSSAFATCGALSQQHPYCSLPGCNNLTMAIGHRALALSHPILELAHVHTAVAQNVSAVAVWQVVLPFPEVIGNVGVIIRGSNI